jgi:hypothetical protein
MLTLTCSILAVVRRHERGGDERGVEPEETQNQSKKETKSSQSTEKPAKKGPKTYLYQ